MENTNNKQRSKKHHYIPEFYTKNFCDSEGLIYVYDKIAKRHIGKKSPAAFCYEIDRNTMQFGDDMNDNFEQLYAEFDFKISDTLTKLIETKTFSVDDFMDVALIGPLLKWRVTAIDEEFDKLSKTTSISDFNSTVMVDGKDLRHQPEIFNKLDFSENIRKAKRVLFPLAPFQNEKNLEDIYNGLFLHSSEPKFAGIMCDNPFIELPNKDFRALNDFVLPISSTDTLIFKRNAEKKVVGHFAFYVQKDILLVHQAKRYVACRDKQHLDEVIKYYEESIEKGFIQTFLDNLHVFIL